MSAGDYRKAKDTALNFAFLFMAVSLWWDEGAPGLLAAAGLCIGGAFVLTRRARRVSRGDDQ